MTNTNRRNRQEFTAEFKAKVAMRALHVTPLLEQGNVPVNQTDGSRLVIKRKQRY